MDKPVTAAEAKGKRIRVLINGAFCRVTMDKTVPLTEPFTGTYMRAFKMPAGPIYLLRNDDGDVVAIDGNDVEAGRVVLEMHASDNTRRSDASE